MTACSPVSLSPPSIETARLAVEEAARYQAGDYAPRELALAREKLSRAEDAYRQEHVDEGRRLSEQATLDAQLAQTKAEATRARIVAIENQTTTNAIDNVR